VGPGEPPAVPGARTIDITGKFVTPGLIDAHSHLGVYPAPEFQFFKSTEISTRYVRSVAALLTR